MAVLIKLRKILVQCLGIMLHHHSVNVSGIGATSHQSPSRRFVKFNITHLHHKGKVSPTKDLIVPKITATLPLHPDLLDLNWKHLSGLQLTNPQFGTPRNEGVICRANIFSLVVFNGRRFGSLVSTSAFRTQFGLVLTGRDLPEHHLKDSIASSIQCYLSTMLGENLR